jgi:transposase
LSLDHHFAEPTAIRTNLGAIFVSLELSRSTWLITSLSPGGGEKMSKHGVAAGNIAALLMRLSELKQKAFARTGKSFHVIAIQEAGLDGFGFIACCRAKGLRAMLSIRPLLRPRGVGGALKPTRSTAKPWCALCWRTTR